MYARIFDIRHRFTALAFSWLTLACAMGAPACGTGGGGSGGDGGSSAAFMPLPTPRQCTGTPTPCAERDALDCTGDCFMLGACKGFADSCFTFFDSFQCQQQDGCSWEGTQCTGSETACDATQLQGSFACGLQSGCTWMPGCIGDSGSCDFLSDTECEAKPGCFLQ